MSIAAMKLALVVLEELADEVFAPYDNKLGDAILALRAAIEDAEKPWVKTYAGGQPNYTAPRQWQGLTDEDREDILRWIEWKEIGSQPVAPQKLIAYVEKKLKEKNERDALRAAIEPRQWQGLTDDERNQFRQWAHPEIIDAIELKLRERNP